ncbi:MAG TPA: hypothetical protein VFG68_05815 [Fimbriiglobus sp.]|nr:hypothetical protein [Fimbriiglobus sp.]
MRTATLNTRVLKTALVGNAKLPTPADRISGFVVGTDYPSTTFLSQGQFLTPRLPEPEPRSRQEVFDAMSMPPAGDPDGLAGRLPGSSACRGPLAAAWRANRASTGRASRPWSHGHPKPVGGDYQSPDRLDDRKDLKAPPAAVRRRTATRTAAAG